MKSIDENGEVEETISLVETTVGRALLSEILPKGMSFELINRTMTKKAISKLLDACYRQIRFKRDSYFC